MARAEAERSTAQKALVESERAVSRAASVREPAASRASAGPKQLAVLEGEQRETAARIDARRGELADWVRRHYVHGAADGVAPLRRRATQASSRVTRTTSSTSAVPASSSSKVCVPTSPRPGVQRRRIVQRRDRLAALEREQRGRQQQLQTEQSRRKAALAEVSRELLSEAYSGQRIWSRWNRTR